VGAARLAPSRRGFEDLGGPGEVELALAGDLSGNHPFAGQRAFDENNLAVRVARDAAAFGIERFDAENQLFQSARNSCQYALPVA
jgi:hypothetical protein